jgi:hypothetical protein
MEPQNTNQPEQQIPDTPSTPQPQPVTEQTQPTLPPSQHRQLTERTERLKRLSIQVMIAGLIGAAVLAVVAVLAGSFSKTFEKSLFTLFLVIVHALACLAFVEQTGKAKKSSFKFFENAVFIIIVLSFFTSIFGVWGLLAGSIVAKLYGTYFILLFASLHGQMLVEARGFQSSINNIVNVNYALMGLVIVLILPIIWSGNTDFPNFYYRLLAAAGIIDGTLTIIAVILHRLYIQKHPDIQSPIFTNIQSVQSGAPGQVMPQKRHIHPLIWLLGIFIVGQFALSLLFGILGAFYR